MAGKLIILGCGGSAGVPAVGNWWGKCDPNEPKNIRTRPSIALKTDTTLVIVDTGPDFRLQMNRENLGAPDAVLITHAHSDHINGIDDLRALMRFRKEKFPTYAFPDTLNTLQKRSDYLFTDTLNGVYMAVCDPFEIKAGVPFTVGDISMMPFEQDHETLTSLGIRVGNVAYSTDMKRLPEKSVEILQGIETWIVDGCGYFGHVNPVHASIPDIIEMNKNIGAKNIYLTHMPASMDYATLLRELPEGFAPCYDGMTLEF